MRAIYLAIMIKDAIFIIVYCYGDAQNDVKMNSALGEKFVNGNCNSHDISYMNFESLPFCKMSIFPSFSSSLLRDLAMNRG